MLTVSVMSAPSSRPPVPRPTARKTAPPPAVVIPAVVIGERVAETFELADDDLVEDAPVAVLRSPPPPSPPPPSPPPPSRSTVVPKVEGAILVKIAPMPVPQIALEPVPKSHVQLEPAPVQTFAPVKAIETARPKLESMLDPSEALFDGMYDLVYADSPWQAARLCASALGRALGARSVIVHAHDLVTHELRAIGVHGDGEFDVLGSTDASEDDLVASAVICNEKPVTMRFDGELPRLAPRRLGMIGGAPRTLVAVPAMAWGRCVAVMEIIDADERFAGRVADSAAYVAERLAAFLSGRAAA